MKTKQEQREELAAAVSRVEQWVAAGNWLGCSWASYPELDIPVGRDAEVSWAIPESVWMDSQRNFEAAAKKELA